jgi:hypothetical protein
MPTQLDEANERAYKQWMQSIGHTRQAGYNVDDSYSGKDYDYRGFFKKHGAVDVKQGQHFTDEFKLPNHETFSNESIYAVGADKAKAGSWNGETFVPAVAPGRIPVKIPGFDKPVMFPAGMTPEQIQQAIETDILPQRKPAKEPEYRAVPGMGARIGRGAQDVVDRLTQLTIGAGEKVGMLEPGIGDLATQAMNEEQAKYEADRQAAKGGKAGFDAARLTGNIGMQAPLALLPGGQKTLVSRALAGAGQGAASGALQFDPTNTAARTAANVAVGGATGAVMGPLVGAIGDKIGKAVQVIAGRAKGLGTKLSGDASDDAILKAVPELQAMTPEERIPLLEEAKKQISQMGVLDDAAMSRKANLVANEITPTKSMVTRDPADWTLERNLQKLAQSPDEQLSGVGKELTDVYQRNDAAMSKQLTDLGQDIPKATQEGYGMTVMRSIDDLADASQKDVSKLYDAVRQAHGDKAGASAENVMKVLSDPDIVDNVDSAPIIGSVSARLKRYGLLDDAGNATGKSLTVNQAEEFRKFVGKIGNSSNTKRIAREFVKAIDEDVLSGFAPVVDESTAIGKLAALERSAKSQGLFESESPTPEMSKAEAVFMKQHAELKRQIAAGGGEVPQSVLPEPGQDYFGEARQAARERFAMLDNPATQRAMNAYGELTQGKTAQNFIKSQVIDAPAQDVKTLVTTLEKIGDQAKKTEAMSAMKGGVLSYLQSKAINPNSGQFSGAALNKAVQEIGDEKLILTLGQTEAAKLKSLAKAALDATYQPAYSAVNNSNTAPMLMSLMQKARAVPGVPLLVTDEAQKIAARAGYEKQLAEALAARSGKLLPPPKSVAKLAEALRLAAPPSAVAALDQQRKPADKKPKDRK